MDEAVIFRLFRIIGRSCEGLRNKYIVDQSKAVISGLCFLLLGAFCLYCLFNKDWIASFVLFVFSGLFGYELAQNAASITVSETGITRSFFGMMTKDIGWGDIKEVGVVGTKVFNKREPQKVGRMYIYFSDKVMTENERFAIALKWPPKKKTFMRFDYKRISQIQIYWPGKIALYNVGMLSLQND